MLRRGKIRLILALLILAGGLAATLPARAYASEVVIYSARKEELIRPALETFQKETGIKVTLLTGKAGDLARRIEVERNDPKADLFLGTTAGIAELLRRKGLLAPYFSPAAQEVPEELQLHDDPASPVGILYPDQGPDGIGTPVFSITAGIMRGAKHPEAARALVDFLLGAKGNRLLVQGEFEIPLIGGVPVPGEDKGVKGLGQFKKARVSQLQLADLEPKVEKFFGPSLIP